MSTDLLRTRRISCHRPELRQEDAEDPEYTAPDNDYSNDNEGVMSLPTM
jgi:hypothetical protein